MSTRIELNQSRVVIEGPLFRVTTEVTYAQGIDKNVFVFNTETDVFEHVATVYGMDTYPASRSEATLEGMPFYRNYNVTVDYTNETTASKAAVYTRQSVSNLTKQYALVSEAFIGSDTYVYVYVGE